MVAFIIQLMVEIRFMVIKALVGEVLEIIEVIPQGY